MGKQLQAKAHIAKLNKLTAPEVTELTSSTVDETALSILKRQGSWGITILGSQRKFILDIQIDPYWLKWQTKRSKVAAKDFATSKFHQDTWNRYLMLGFVSAHIQGNAISNLDLRRSYKALWSKPVLPSATTLGNISPREYAPTVDAIMKQLVSWKQASLALEGWTSKNTLTTTLGIAYYMDRNSALHVVQLTFDEVDCLFFPAVDNNSGW